MIKNLSLPPKKITITAAISIVIFLVVWFFLYAPTRRTLGQFKQALSTVEREIQEIEISGAQNENADKIMNTLQERFQRIDSKFPKKEEEALRLLSDFARKLNIGIIAIHAQPRTLFLDENKQKMMGEEKSCYQFSVSLEMKSTYQDLEKYLATLKESLPALVVVERVRITKDPAGTALLNVNLDLSLYLLS